MRYAGEMPIVGATHHTTVSVRARLALGATLVWTALTGCSTYFPINARLVAWNPSAGYRELRHVSGAERSDGLLLMVAFSGGGTRAASFAYGVLEELAATPVEIGGRRRRLLDEVDLISGVSGGSVTAAYYGLYGDRIFTDFERRFLKRNVQLGMFLQILLPQNWPRLYSAYFDRSELAAEYFDDYVFDGATFHDLDRLDRPRILINATDLLSGDRFGFTQEQFDFICSDLSSFPLSRAVAASSAVPVILSPVTLWNYAGKCGFQSPAWLEASLRDDQGSIRRRVAARSLSSYLDARRRRFIHLVDGGISDNLGVRGLTSRLLLERYSGETLESEGWGSVREIVVIVVNAETAPDPSWSLRDFAPPLAAVLDWVTSAQISRYNVETTELLQAELERVTAALSARGHPVHFHLVEVSFAGVTDERERRRLASTPTSFYLRAKAVDKLRQVGRELLHNSVELRTVLAELAALPPR
jgi:NTE family protein